MGITGIHVCNLFRECRIKSPLEDAEISLAKKEPGSSGSISVRMEFRVHGTAALVDMTYTLMWLKWWNGRGRSTRTTKKSCSKACQRIRRGEVGGGTWKTFGIFKFSSL